MSAALVKTSGRLQAQLQSIPPVSWCDLQRVTPETIREYIQTLEAACLEDSRSVNPRTGPGIVNAVNDGVIRAMAAREVPVSSMALQYRLHALALAEKQTLMAVQLARNTWPLLLARRQLQAICQLTSGGGRAVTRASGAAFQIWRTHRSG